MTESGQAPGAAAGLAAPALLLLALLPVAATFPAIRTPAIAAVVIAAALLWARGLGGACSARSTALLDRGDGTIGPWELILLGIALVICAAYVVAGTQVIQIAYNDGGYYYGVARHMARTGRFEEPILWHFLHPPDTLIHTPFDYWGCTTSLMLAVSLAIFGDSLRTAFVTMSVVTGIALLAFWYLVCCALPLRHRATQLLALLLYGLTLAMNVYRSQPESIAVVHLFIVLALIAFCRGRTVLAVLCGFAILLTRSDGLVLFGLVTAACLVHEWRRGRGGVRSVALAWLACVATYATWSLVSFGTLTPPAPQLLPLLPRYMRVFDYVTPEQRTWVSPLTRFTARYVADQLGLAFATLRAIPFAPFMNAWLVLSLLPALRLWRRPLPHVLIWAMAAAYFVVAWMAGPGFAQPRTPFTYTPLIILAGALGVDMVLDGLGRWIAAAAAPRARAIVAGALVLAGCALLLMQLRLPQKPQVVANFPDNLELRKLNEVLRGEPVATNVSWYMIAHTDSPAVAIPHNGAAAIEAVLARYQIRWLVIPMTPRSGGRSRPVLDDIVLGRRTQLGQFRLERVPVDGVQSAVFRVLPAL